MTDIQSAAIVAIQKQQRGHGHDIVWTVGELLKDECRRNYANAVKVAELIRRPGTSLKDACRKVRQAARGGALGSWEITEILREIYGLNEPEVETWIK